MKVVFIVEVSLDSIDMVTRGTKIQEVVIAP